MSKIAIIVPAAPHYKNAQGVEERWYGRISLAIDHALQLDAHLIIVGDAYNGEDNEAFKQLALERGVHTSKIHVQDNGLTKDRATTHHDIRAAVQVLCEKPQLRHVDQLLLVSCWYHCARVYIELHKALLEEMPVRVLGVRVTPVWDNWRHGLYRLLHWHGELRGCLDLILGRKHQGRGQFATLGKPVFAERDEHPTPTPVRAANNS